MGVKYCFRYNARSRQLRLTEDGEPITLENMPRPHRRRREKKLMTMDEVNEKFPMLKYKNWVAGRARDGLPSKGGVSSPPSRANSVRSVEGVVPELPPKERESDELPAAVVTTVKEKRGPSPVPEETSSEVANLTETSTEGQSSTAIPAEAPLPAVPGTASEAHDNDHDHDHDHTDDEDDDEHINAALPPECLGSPGDTCAICIDTLEDDDDVRGLTCGHAFHAVCLDPWLTSRRACCPLCKADYYTPKPRPLAPDAGDGTTATATASATADAGHRMNMPLRSQASWMAIRGRAMPARFAMRANDHVVDRPAGDAFTPRAFGLFSRPRRPPPTSGRGTTAQLAERNSNANTDAANSRSNWLASVRSAFPPFRSDHARGLNNQPGTPASPPTASGANPAVSPSQLEAGVRSETR